MLHDRFVCYSYSSCNSESSVVNFWGQPYHVRNGDWVIIKLNLLIEREMLAAHVKLELLRVRLITYCGQGEETFTNLQPPLTAWGTMEDHGGYDVGNIVEAFIKFATFQICSASFRWSNWWCHVCFVDVWCIAHDFLAAVAVQTNWRAPTVVIQESHLNDTSVARDSTTQPTNNSLAAPERETVLLYPDFATYNASPLDLRVVGSN